MKKLFLSLLFPALLYGQSVTLDSEFISAAATELIIDASGIITTENTGIVFFVDTNGDASTDNLDTITQGTDADTFVFLTNADAAEVVVIRDGIGNINTGRDITLAVPYEDWVILFFDTATWYLVAESDRLLDLERGGLGEDVSAYVGGVGIDGTGTYQIDDMTKLEAIGADDIIVDGEIATQSVLKGHRTDLVAATVAGGTNNQTDATLITAEHSYITTGIADSAVLLPPLYAGANFKIENETANNKVVWPAVGDNIGAGDNLSITIPALEILTVHSKDGDDANSYLTVSYPVVEDVVDIRASGDRLFHDTDQDGTKDAGELFIDGQNLNSTVKSVGYEVGDDDDEELYGGVVYVDTAVTITLPAILEGMSFTVVTIGAVAVTVDPNINDGIRLDGGAFDTDGDSITNSSTAGDMVVFTYYSATGWHAATDGNWTAN